MQSDMFNPPANLDEFKTIPRQSEAWSEMLSESFDQAISCIENPSEKSPCGRKDAVGIGLNESQFYNPLKTSVSGSPFVVEIIWLGYPRRLTVENGEELGFQKSDELHPLTEFLRDTTLASLNDLRCRGQDEYCEWHVTCEPQTGKILRVAFTCEAPEYWSALAGGYPSNPFYYEGPQTTEASGDPDKLLALYRELVSPEVQLGDLFFLDSKYECPGADGKAQGFLQGQYNPYNKWNTSEGIVHLTHPANRLLAEIQLAADGTVLRTRDGLVILEADQFICCAGHANPNRSSDPNILNGVNQLARTGAMITLQDPVGLYMDSLNVVGWTKPDGQTGVGDYWKIVRGQPGMAVRAVYEVPENEGPTVSDILIAGKPLRYAGQIAQAIRMKLVGIAYLPKERRQLKFVPCEFRCCRKTDNQSQLKLVKSNANCPAGFEPGSPGLPVLSVPV
jgi:hypothetical protein